MRGDTDDKRWETKEAAETTTKGLCRVELDFIHLIMKPNKREIERFEKLKQNLTTKKRSNSTKAVGFM